MSERKFTKDHEWVEINGKELTVGITDFAQENLGDLVFIELPEVGSDISVGDEVVVIESVKAAGGVNLPIEGVVTAINDDVADDPELVNRDPEGDGWLFKVELSNNLEDADFLDENSYKDLLNSQ